MSYKKDTNGSVQSAAAASQSKSALLIIDMLSDFDFEDGEQLFQNATGVLDNIATLRNWARANEIPIIYVNDGYGKSDEEFRSYLDELRENSPKAARILRSLEPAEEDRIVLKPQHSGFFASALGAVLMSMSVEEVIVAGVTTDICVMYTAHDAYMRGLRVRVPEDCSAAVEAEHHSHSLSHLRRVVEADTSPSNAILSSTAKADDDGGSPHGEEAFASAQ